MEKEEIELLLGTDNKKIITFGKGETEDKKEKRLALNVQKRDTLLKTVHNPMKIMMIIIGQEKKLALNVLKRGTFPVIALKMILVITIGGSEKRIVLNVLRKVISLIIVLKVIQIMKPENIILFVREDQIIDRSLIDIILDVREISMKIKLNQKKMFFQLEE
jgi:hypothetical protein